MKVRLTNKELQFINYFLLEEKEELFQRFKSKLSSSDIFVKIDDEMADEIRDWAGEKLQICGFAENYELTNEGAILESLIDKFHVDSIADSNEV